MAPLGTMIPRVQAEEVVSLKRAKEESQRGTQSVIMEDKGRDQGTDKVNGI